MYRDRLLVAYSADELSAFVPHWKFLLARCPDHRFSQSVAWAEAGWRFVCQPRGRELRCLSLWSGDRLVGVWPLVTHLDDGRRIVRPLGAEASEYCAPLVEPGPNARRRMERLWQAAARLGDLAILPYVREDSVFASVAQGAGLWRTTDFPAPALSAPRRDYADWAAYQASLSASVRATLRRARRRLAEKGAFVIGIEPCGSRAETVDWLLAHKKRWLESQGMSSAWIGRRDYRDFLVALAEASDGETGMMLFTLKVEGVPIAADLVTVDGARVEALMGAYDPAWSVYSPGQLITEHCLAWAFERDLDYDMRIGEASYKKGWAPRSCGTEIWYIATNLRGLPFVLQRQGVVAFGRLKSRLAAVKNQVKATLKRRLGGVSLPVMLLGFDRYLLPGDLLFDLLGYAGA
jgi:CelD/BcsL family acetyltransferase involved in cellulose biosynthesis